MTVQHVSYSTKTRLNAEVSQTVLQEYLTDHRNYLIPFSSHSVVDWMLCLGSVSRCITRFQPSFSCGTDGFVFALMPRSCMTAEQGQIISPPQLCLKLDLRCLCRLCCDKPSMVLCVMAKHLHFGLVCQRTLFQKSCGLCRQNFANLSYAAVFFSERRGCLSVTLPSHACSIFY